MHVHCTLAHIIIIIIVLLLLLFLLYRGSEIIIKKRYKQHIRNSMIKGDPSPPLELTRGLNNNPVGFEYLIIVDFEATCEQHNPPDYIHEVIEFPALLFNIKELKVVRLIIIVIAIHVYILCNLLCWFDHNALVYIRPLIMICYFMYVRRTSFIVIVDQY